MKLISTSLLRENRFENGYRESRTRRTVKFLPNVLGLLDCHRLREGLLNTRRLEVRCFFLRCYRKPSLDVEPYIPFSRETIESGKQKLVSPAASVGLRQSIVTSVRTVQSRRPGRRDVAIDLDLIPATIGTIVGVATALCWRPPRTQIMPRMTTRRWMIAAVMVAVISMPLCRIKTDWSPPVGGGAGVLCPELADYFQLTSPGILWRRSPPSVSRLAVRLAQCRVLFEETPKGACRAVWGDLFRVAAVLSGICILGCTIDRRWPECGVVGAGTELRRFGSPMRFR